LSFFCKRTTTKKQQQQQQVSVRVRVRAGASCSNGEEEVRRLTVSDSELASRGFSVRRTTEGLDVAALNEVFSRVGFPRRQEERLRRALDHSRVVWLSSSSSTSTTTVGRPVAFARAAGDGVFNAVVWDVVVEPSRQGLGLGRAVMERLVHDLRRDGVCNIVLYAEPRVVGFYRLLDFAMDPDGIRGMAYYRKSSSTS
jgi:aralkylamine N-acetyltransferase